jgi:hypothetical protein
MKSGFCHHRALQRLLLVSLAMLAVVVVASACGSGGNDERSDSSSSRTTGTTASTPYRPATAAQTAYAAGLERANEDLAAATSSLTTAESYAALRPATARLAVAVTRVRALKPSPTRRADHRRLVSALDRAVRSARAIDSRSSRADVLAARRTVATRLADASAILGTLLTAR